MPTIEMNVQCRICHWKGTSYSSSSKILCEACGCECDKIVSVTPDTAPAVKDPWIEIQKKRVKKVTLKLRGIVLALATEACGNLQRSNGYHPPSSDWEMRELENGKKSFMASIEAKLVSGIFDRWIDASQYIDSSSVFQEIRNTANNLSMRIGDGHYYSNILTDTGNGYLRYCTDSTVIDED